jgi:hypothetical protein
MRTFLAAVAAALLSTGTATGTATADPESPGPLGLGCGLLASDVAGAGVVNGVVVGGPVAATGTLRCTIQVGAASTHAGADAAPPVAVHGDGAVTAGPAIRSFVAGPDDPVWLCTAFTYDDGLTVYRHAPEFLGEAGHWSTDPASACALVTSVQSPEWPPPFLDDIEIRHGLDRVPDPQDVAAAGRRRPRVLRLPAVRQHRDGRPLGGAAAVPRLRRGAGGRHRLSRSAQRRWRVRLNG